MLIKCTTVLVKNKIEKLKERVFSANLLRKPKLIFNKLSAASRSQKVIVND